MSEIVPSEGSVADIQQAARHVAEAAYLLDTWYHLPNIESLAVELRRIEEQLWEEAF